MIDVSKLLSKDETINPETWDGKPFTYRVTMVSWSQDDRLVVTAVSDHSLKGLCVFPVIRRHLWANSRTSA